MSKGNKFHHKCLFDPKYAYCEKTKTWSSVYVDGKGMFCSLNTKQHNGFKTWHNAANI